MGEVVRLWIAAWLLVHPATSQACRDTREDCSRFAHVAMLGFWNSVHCDGQLSVLRLLERAAARGRVRGPVRHLAPGQLLRGLQRPPAHHTTAHDHCIFRVVAAQRKAQCLTGTNNDEVDNYGGGFGGVCPGFEALL